jgi:aryl-alcohol dehydrogenase-like predicted oxidoreductase
LGINFFDSSNAYGWGGSERALGKAVAGRRNEVVICTKINPAVMPEGANKPVQRSFTRDFVFREAEGSLRRLGTDFIDLYLLHNPDGVTPAEQIVDTMDALVKSGKIRHWGVSNHDATQVRQFVELSEQRGKAPIAGIQRYYNIAGRYPCSEERKEGCDLEQEMFPLLREKGLGLMAFSPLGAGTLAPGRTAEPGTPLEDMLAALDDVATDLGVSRAQVCVAWVLTHPEVTSVLAGAERPEHVEDNFAGTKLVLPDDAIAALNAASDYYREETQ